MPAAGGRGDRRSRRRSSSTRARWSATYEPYVRLASCSTRSRPGTFPKKTMLANSGAESGRERRQAGAQVHRPAGDHLLRGRLSRPHAADAQPDQQVRPVQERLRPVRAGDRPAADAERLSHAGRHDRGRSTSTSASASSNTRWSRRSIRRRSPRSSSSRCRARPASFRCRRDSSRGIRELCTQHGIVMIADEVQCGFGRTGRLFAHRALRRRARPHRHRQVARRGHADRRRHRPRRDHGCGAPRRRRRHLRRQPGRVRRRDRNICATTSCWNCRRRWEMRPISHIWICAETSCGRSRPALRRCHSSKSLICAGTS